MGQGGPAAVPLDKAAAVGTSDANIKRAEELFRKGAEHYKAQRWAEAEKAYREAWSIQKTYDIATNVAQVLFKQGKHREAATFFAFALKNWPLSGKPEMRELARQRFADARAKVGALLIRVNMPGAEISVNGISVGVSPLEDEVFVDPGELSVEAKLADHEPQKKSLLLLPGGAETVEMNLVKPKPKVEPEDPKKPIEPPKRNMIPAYAMGAGALVGFGLGLGFYLAGTGQVNDASTLALEIAKAGGSCKAGAQRHAQCDELDSIKNTGRIFDGLSLTSTIVGGLCGVGTALYLAWPYIKKSPPAESAPKAKGTALIPVINQHTAGALLVGAF